MTSRASRDAAIGLFSWAAPLLTTFACTPILIRSLGPAQYGLYVLVSAFSIYSLHHGLGRALIRFTPQVSDDPAAGVAMLIRPATALAVLIATVNLTVLLPLTYFVLRDDVTDHSELAPALVLLALMILATALMQLHGAVAQIVGQFPRYGVITALTGACASIGAAVIAWRIGSWVSVLAWQATVGCGGAVAMMALALPIVRRSSTKSAGPVPLPRELFRFAFVAGLPQLIGAAITLAERAVVAEWFGAAVVGGYSVAWLVAQLLHSVMFHASVMFPVAASRMSVDELIRVYEQAMRLVLVTAVTGGVGLWICGPRFVLLWAGAATSAYAAEVVGILASAAAVLGILVLPWWMAEARGFPEANVRFLASAAIAMALLVPLLLRFGPEGVAVARVLSLAMAPLYVVLVERRVFGASRVRFWLGSAWRMAIVATLTAAVMSGIISADSGWQRLVVAAAAGVAISLVSSMALGYIPWRLRYRDTPHSRDRS